MAVFRFVAAPAFKIWVIEEGMQGFSVAQEWRHGATHFISTRQENALSHFGCNLVHEDLAHKPDVDVMHAEMNLKQTVEHDCNGNFRRNMVMALNTFPSRY